MNFKLGETYKTRDGRERRVIYIGKRYMIVIDALESPSSRYFDGRTTRDAEHPLDLMPRTKQVTRWLNVYADLMDDTPHVTEEQANTSAGEDRLACVSYTVTIPDDGSEDS